MHFEEMYFANSGLSKKEIAQIIKKKFEKAGLQVFGFTFHSLDEFWNDETVDKCLEDLKQIIDLNKILGAEYVTFQIFLPEKYMIKSTKQYYLMKKYIFRDNHSIT